VVPESIRDHDKQKARFSRSDDRLSTASDAITDVPHQSLGCSCEVCYGERGLAGERAAVWVAGETLTIEYRAEALIQYQVAVETSGRGLREVGEPTFFPHRFPSPQPFLPPLDETAWHPTRRLAPYRPRRTCEREAQQEPLFAGDAEASVG